MEIKVIGGQPKAQLEHGYTHRSTGGKYFVEGVPTQCRIRAEGETAQEAMEAFGKVVDHVDLQLMGLDSTNEGVAQSQPLADRAKALLECIAKVEEKLGIQLEHEDHQGAFVVMDSKTLDKITL
ncbi:MAG: hypothetical protein KAT70_03410 [Thermoplasmata archaeon]|nr:hypothetical protein [Thermoplasmata archaeon]